MSSWFQLDVLLSAAALLIAAVAVWASKYAQQQAVRSADAAKKATKAARLAARESRQSAQLALQFLDVHSTHRAQTTSALLCLGSIRRNAPASPSQDGLVSPGFAFDLQNRGHASARRIAMGLRIDGTAQDWHPTLPDLDPGATRQVRFPFSDRMYLSHGEFTITLSYEDTQRHRMVFVLRKTPGELAVPRLVAASLDGGPHPGHPIDAAREHIETRVHPSVNRRTGVTAPGQRTVRNQPPDIRHGAST